MCIICFLNCVIRFINYINYVKCWMSSFVNGWNINNNHLTIWWLAFFSNQRFEMPLKFSRAFVMYIRSTYSGRLYRKFISPSVYYTRVTNRKVVNLICTIAEEFFWVVSFFYEIRIIILKDLNTSFLNSNIAYHK